MNIFISFIYTLLGFLKKKFSGIIFLLNYLLFIFFNALGFILLIVFLRQVLLITSLCWCRASDTWSELFVCLVMKVFHHKHFSPSIR